jgi:O-antigen/teichoic acid export membrane protein
MQKLTSTILRNSAFGIAAQILIKILSFGFSVLIVRNLGASAFGQYSAVIAFGITFSFISDLGLSPYAVREIARMRDKPDGIEKARQLYGNVLVLRLLLSAITIILVIIAAWMTNRPLLMIGAIALNSLSLLIYSVQGASDAVLAGFERLDITSGAKVFNQLCFVLIGGAALYLGWGYYGLILASIIGVGVMAVICWRGVRSLGVRLPRPDPRVWLQLLRASLPFGVIGFALGLSYKFDTVLLNIYRGDAETGFYSAAYNLVFSMVLFSNVLNTALYPSLSRQSVNDPGKLNQSFERSLRYLMIFALPVAVGIWVVADQIIPFLFTQSFRPAIPALRIVIWVVPLMFASEFFGYIVLISGKEKKAARAVLVSTAFNVLINFLLVPRFGILAAAVMTVATEAVLVSQYIWEIRSVISTFDPRLSFIYPFLASIMMGAAAMLLQGFIPLLVNIFVSVVIYVLLLFAFRVISKDEIILLRNLRVRSEKAATS